MRKILLLLLFGAVIFSVIFSMLAAAQQKTEQEPGTALQFTTTATISDIMVSMVDPSADYLWDSVATVVSANGRQSRAPSTDKSWAELRRNTIVLLESTNLLMMPGRRVASPGDKSKNPNIELPPEQIEILMSQDRESWNKLSRGLYDETLLALKAVDAKDAGGVVNAGARIDNACESCHLKFWYPKASK
jgi:hypothetical protein